MVWIGFDNQSFSAAVCEELATPGISPASAAEHYMERHLSRCFESLLGPKLISPPIIRVYPQSKFRYWTLPKLADAGSELWYTEIKFSTGKADRILEMHLEWSGFELLPIDYGSGLLRAYLFKSKTLKTQVNHEMRLNHTLFPPQLWRETSGYLKEKGRLENAYIANPFPNLEVRGQIATMPGHRIVSFDHMVTGERMFCDCARQFHSRIVVRASAQLGGYGSWVRHTNELLDGASYDKGICHLCIAEASGPEAAALRYGDCLYDFEGCYIDHFMIGQNLEIRTARAEVQRILGLSRWKRESLMYKIIKEIFKDFAIKREATPPWLGRQRLDVYIPALNLAFEYQGEQHFKAIDHFGGEDGHRNLRERDQLKKRLCDENGVRLIYVYHTDSLTIPAMTSRLAGFLPTDYPSID